MTEMDNIQTRTRSPMAKYFPIIGAILGLCMAVLALVSSGTVYDMAESRAPGRFPPAVLATEVNMSALDMGFVTYAQLAVAVGLWLVYMVASWTLVAGLAKATEPNKKAKKQLRVTDKSLKDERKGIYQEKARRKKQRKKLQKKAFEENRKSGERIG